MGYSISLPESRFPKRSVPDSQLPPQSAVILTAVTTQMNLFHSALNVIGDGIIALDMHQRVALWNQWMAKHSRFAAHDAIGRSFFELFPSLKDGCIHEAIHLALANNLASSFPPLSRNADFLLQKYRDESCANKDTCYKLKIVPFNTGHVPPHCLIHIVDLTHRDYCTDSR